MDRDSGRERSGRERKDGDVQEGEDAEEEGEVGYWDKGGALALGSVC